MKQDLNIYLNRELSWLDFNARVLLRARDTTIPLCERINFLCIYQSNLDEFFQVRVGTLVDRSLVDSNAKDDKTHLTPREQIAAICNKVRLLNIARDDIYFKTIEELNTLGNRIVSLKDMPSNILQEITNAFATKHLEALQQNSIVVPKGSRLPFIKSNAIFVLSSLLDSCKKETFGIVEIPSSIGRLFSIDGEHSFVTEEICEEILPKIFCDYSINDSVICRITRSADLDALNFYDEEFDFCRQVKKFLRIRQRLSPIRLEFWGRLHKELVKRLKGNRKTLLAKQVFASLVPLDLSFLKEIKSTLKSHTDLFYAPRTPATIDLQAGESIITKVFRQDLLLFYPYDNFEYFIRLLEEASLDPSVESIQITLYRLSHNSRVILALEKAGKQHKKVNVVVEIKARFDEENNLESSLKLKAAGCQVIYGIPHLKIHSKLCLITRHSNDEVQYITQVGTGNYNEVTARLYTDFCLITANKTLGKEAQIVFDSLLKQNAPPVLKNLLVSPNNLLFPILHFIEEQIERAKKGKEAFIGVKINSLTDKKIIDKLVCASIQGVHIKLIVRGICCLKVAKTGDTRNINIRSIVGRYLEHSRIYIFGPKDCCRVFIASADFMTRNTHRRVEVACPIYDESIKSRIYDIFDKLLKDDTNAFEQENGNYKALSTLQYNCQESFYHEP